jgi:acetolactate synthase-1/2/3 large subunit
MAKVDGGRLFARALKREGVEQVFVLSGGHVMPIFYGCRAEEIKVIDCRHEMSAAYAADAYARVTGKAGVVITTAGPGVTDTITAMAEARLQGVPVIQIGGASPLKENETGPLQDMNTLEIMGAATKWARKIYDTRRIPEYVAMAFRQAYDATPGPVYLECATDTIAATIEDDEKIYYPEHYRTTAQPFGDPLLVKQAADLLANAKCPVLILGDTARFSAQYPEAILELVDHLQIPVITQTMCRGLFAPETHPLFRMGTVGLRALREADVILALAVCFDFRLLKGRAPAVNPAATIIQVHPDITKIGYNTRAQVGIVGGATGVAKQILEEIKSITPPKQETPWVKRAQELMQGSLKGYIEGFSSDSIPVHPGRCAFEVGKFLADEGRDWTVVCDGGDAAQWIKAAVYAYRPGQIINYGPLGTIGTGAGFTLGAYMASKKPVLYYTGDGSIGFYPMEFETFLKQGIPVVCVISNDSAWGMIKLAETLRRPEEVKKGHVANELSYLFRYEKLASLWDGYGELVTRPEDIIPAIKRGYASGKPAIINVEVDQYSMSPVTKGMGRT